MELRTVKNVPAQIGVLSELPTRPEPPQGPEDFGLDEYPPAASISHEHGQMAETQALLDGRTVLVTFQMQRSEDFEVFDSEGSMRFGVRHYTEEQFDLIHRATAERDLPTATPFDLDD